MTTFNTVEEQNEHLNQQGLAGYDKAFTLVFRDRKKVFFEVNYGTHGHKTQNPYFSTSAMRFNHVRTDWNEGGQAQEILLSKGSMLRKFFEKWDTKHLKVLTLEEFKELESDLEKLKEKKPFLENSRFYNIVKFDRELSNKKAK